MGVVSRSGILRCVPPRRPHTTCGRFPLTRLCCRGLASTPGRSDSLSLSPTSRSPASRARRSQSTARLSRPGVSLLGRRRVSPVPTSAVPAFRAHYAAGFLGTASLQALHPFTVLLPVTRGSAPGWLLAEANFTTRQASPHAADRWLAPSGGGLDSAPRRTNLSARRRAATKVAWSLLWPDFHRPVDVSLQDAL
jgi:hypothetical protein